MTDDINQLGQGLIYVDEDGNGHCPKTGKKLIASG